MNKGGLSEVLCVESLCSVARSRAIGTPTTKPVGACPVWLAVTCRDCGATNGSCAGAAPTAVLVLYT